MGSSKSDSATNGDGSFGPRHPESHSDIFSEGEKVIAYYGDRLYEAKVQKAEARKNEWKYFIHYHGWSKRWDEWVGADCLVKYTEENILNLQAFNKEQGLDTNRISGFLAQPKPKLSTGEEEKKRKRSLSIEDFSSVGELVNIHMPSALRKQLFKDAKYVNQQDMLVKLPCSPSVDVILTKYLKHRSKKDGMISDAVAEMLKGIRCYFDRALPVILLYHKERQQYHASVADNVSPSSVYGAEHLLRLLVKLPELLPYTNMEKDLEMRLQQMIQDFLKYLRKNRRSFFMSAYEEPKVLGGASSSAEQVI